MLVSVEATFCAICPLLPIGRMLSAQAFSHIGLQKPKDFGTNTDRSQLNLLENTTKGKND